MTIFGAASIAGAQAPPSTDIYLAPLHRTRAGVTIGAPVNITHRDGYDNQPSFAPNSRAVLFTSVRDGGQSDIYRYDLARRSITRLTHTPESEYSATVMPGGKRFSVIRVEADSTQRLWSFALDGTDPRLVIESLKPVGYHVWLDANTLAMFVLGNPNALVLGNLRTGTMDTVARSIGRSLARIPGGFTFTRSESRTHSMLRSMKIPGRDTADIAPLPERTQDIAWLRDGSVLAGSGSRLVRWTRRTATWTDAADLESAGLRDITRLAVSPDGKWIAIVAVPR